MNAMKSYKNIQSRNVQLSRTERWGQARSNKIYRISKNYFCVAEIVFNKSRKSFSIPSWKSGGKMQFLSSYRRIFNIIEELNELKYNNYWSKVIHWDWLITSKAFCLKTVAFYLDRKCFNIHRKQIIWRSNSQKNNQKK